MYRILVIDDEITFRTAVVYQLEDLGYSVEVAGTARTGIECLVRSTDQQCPFDVVLTDMMMPQTADSPSDPEAGLIVVEAIKRIAKDALVVVMTAHGSIENAVKAIRLGAYDYLPKPFTPEELIGGLPLGLRSASEYETTSFEGET